MMLEADLPAQIGPYRVTGRLGRGGMGEVLRGHDDRLDRPVALKRIHPDRRDPEKARRRFRREARAVARLSHPAIVQVYDWVSVDDEDWLVMELVEGRPLDAVLAGGPLPPLRAAAIARQIAAGLALAHARGLVHRDLKPANVMVTAAESESDQAFSEQVKILDFGLAKKVRFEAADGSEEERLSTLTGTGRVIGTVASMSPEQAMGHPVDHRSDLFSLGALLYEMLSGGPPFKGETAVETLSRICSARERPLSELVPDLPDALTELVGRLLEKEPARRPANAGEVMAELDRMLAMPSPAPQAGEPTPAVQMAPAPDDPTLAAETTVGFGLEKSALPMTDDFVTKRTGDQNRSGVRKAVELTDASGSYLSRKVSPGWMVRLAALVAVGLWGWSERWTAPAGEQPAVEAAETVAPAPAVELSSYQLYQRGMELLERYDRKGNIDRAIDDFQRALSIDETYAPALAGLARAYWLDYYTGSRDLLRREQGLAAARRAVELDEYLAVARVSLGLLYLESGRHEDAVREFEQALVLEPLNANAQFGLARVFEVQENLKQAEEKYRLAIEADPGHWHALSNLGALHLRNGRYQEAEAAFQRTLELVPDGFIPLRNLGVSYYVQGRLAEAAGHFQRALQIQPEPSLYTNLGTIHFVQGLYPQAASAFEKAIENGGANRYLLWGNLGDAYRWIPDREAKARDAYQRAIQLLHIRLEGAPEDATLRSRLILYLAKSGDHDQAMGELALLVERPDNDANTWFRLAVAAEVCDRRERALALLELAVQAGFSIEEIQQDPELLTLRQDVRYHRLAIKFQPT